MVVGKFGDRIAESLFLVGREFVAGFAIALPSVFLDLHHPFDRAPDRAAPPVCLAIVR